MRIESLLLRNFRNYASVQFEFAPTLNEIVGKNGQGKTNLLEALYFISTGRSFRTSRLTDLIKQGESYFYLEAHFVKDGISQVIKTSFNGQIRRAQHNETEYGAFSHLLGILPMVLCAPEDLNLITGSPSERRRFLDLHSAQLDPLYIYHLSRYYKAMKQRNCLLRSQSEQTLDTWEQIMALSAPYITQTRQTALTSLESSLTSEMNHISDGAETLSLAYSHSTSNLLETLKKNRSREMHLGLTLAGPHRDDITISINSQAAKTYASEGQKRSCAIAIRLSERTRFETLLSTPPLMAVDDLGIQLDSTRRHTLIHRLGQCGQVFITSTESSSTPSHLLQIAAGEVIPNIRNNL